MPHPDAALPPRGPNVPDDLDPVFDLDLGELVPGHHVIARGLKLRYDHDTVDLHYEFAPGITAREQARLGFFALVFGLGYEGDPDPGWNGGDDGAIAPCRGGPTQHGVRSFAPAPPPNGRIWFPAAPTRDDGWHDEDATGRLVVDLASGTAWFEPGPLPPREASVADDELAQAVAAIARDLETTLGWGPHQATAFAERTARRYAEWWRADLGVFAVMVAEDVQQHLHDTFVDTTWPACPLHPRHPLWLDHDRAVWRCAQAGVDVAALGSLPSST
jgi:hypothetical protein